MTNTPGVSFLKIASKVAQSFFILKSVANTAMISNKGAKTLKSRSMKIPTVN